MAQPSRRQKIETMLRQEPSDKFLQYALAMELEKEGEHESSLARLRSLTEDAPPHVPAFFMAGQQLTRLGRIAEAREMLRKGIEAARQEGNSHAAGEMSEFLASLGQFGDDE